MFEVTIMDKDAIREFADYMKDLGFAWHSPKCNDKLKKSIISVSNLMIKKKVRIQPEFKSYFSSVINFMNSNQSEDNFLTWQECINKILNGKKGE